MDEATAITRLKAGDLSGLQALVEQYQVEATQAASIITGDQAAAEDIVQAAFLRVIDKIGGFDSSRPFRPWFLRIVVNDSIKAGIRLSKQVSLQDDEQAHYEALLQNLDLNDREPEDAVERKELVAEMHEAIARLSPSQRAAIISHYFLGISTSEAARQLGCAPGTLRWHLSTARSRLRTMLASFK